jgi:hypothetical protein
MAGIGAGVATEKKKNAKNLKRNGRATTWTPFPSLDD